MKKARSDLKLERRSSIESEPRTLTLEQLHYAREAARNVMNTKTMEEAQGIFTEGLKPVLSVRQRGRLMKGFANESEELAGHFAVPDHLRLLPPFMSGMRDIVTSPF